VLLRQTASIGLFMMMGLAAKAETLVVAAPFSEFPAIAAQMRDGAKAAIGASVAGNWVIKEVDAGCTEKTAQGVSGLILAEKPDAVIGLPCIESLNPALAELGPLGIAVITIASRVQAPSLLAMKNQWRLYRTGPRENQATAATARLIVEAWRTVPFAILDDGTVFARDLAKAIGEKAESAQVKPVLIASFEPQLESQKKLIDQVSSAGATHVFIAGDRANIAQIANEAAGLRLTIAGPESLLAVDADIPLPPGVRMVARDMVTDHQVELQEGYQQGYGFDAYSAAEIAMALKTEPVSRSFKTAGGLVTIAPDGFVEPVNFAMFRYDGAMFQKDAP
jgi:branched-chain amino acid transport system substrate-binding protein